MTRRCDFNPRAPCGARPQQLLGQCAGMAFQSTRPVRGATTLQELEFVGQVMHISIHAPHAGATASERAKTCCKCLFQSTRPMRGATGAGSPGRFFQSDFNPRAPCGARPRQDLRGHLCGLHFNPRAPCGARRVVIAAPHHRPVISIHAPHAGRDSRSDSHSGQQHLFQSTHPSRGATADKVTERLRHEISIHAPHAGRDTRWSSVGSARADFNPRAPCGARRHPQSHPAGSGAISIHAPHAGRDDFSNASQVGGALFQSTRPVRARRAVRIQPVSAA